MATMFPAEVEQFTTLGEERLYHFLQEAARPDSQFLAWYEPSVDGREPDFILLSPDCGVIVLEVKDWALSQILEADPRSVRLNMGGQEETRKNPQAQCHEYVKTLMLRLSTDRKKTGAGKLPLPITGGTVFPNIWRGEFSETPLPSVIPEGKALFCDELHELSPFSTDPSGAAFRKWLKEHFPPLFPFTLSPQLLDWMRGILFPIARMELPRRAGCGSAASEAIQVLDLAQEQIARDIGQGKRLLYGPSGSGKTLILAHQAWHLARSRTGTKHILITCFNLSLAGYIRRLLARKQAPLGSDAIEVVPFYDLCERILGERIAHAREATDYYTTVTQMALEMANSPECPLRGAYDAVLVDEGQDFMPDMARLVLALLKPTQGTLTVACDIDQSIYTEAIPVWEQLNIAALRVSTLNQQYRNTRQIARLATRLRGAASAPISFAGPEGEQPRFLAFADESHLLIGVAEDIARRVAEGVPLAEIAVLYVSSQLADGDLLPLRLMTELEACGILTVWSAEDERAKRRFDITTDSVTISTIHSAKGMDFSEVYILGLEKLQISSGSAQRLAYVGLTRAKLRLTLVYHDDKGLIPFLHKK